MEVTEITQLSATKAALNNPEQGDVTGEML